MAGEHGNGPVEGQQSEPAERRDPLDVAEGILALLTAALDSLHQSMRAQEWPDRGTQSGAVILDTDLHAAHESAAMMLVKLLTDRAGKAVTAEVRTEAAARGVPAATVERAARLFAEAQAAEKPAFGFSLN